MGIVVSVYAPQSPTGCGPLQWIFSCARTRVSTAVDITSSVVGRTLLS